MKSNKSILNLNNSRKKEQIEVMKKIISDGVCPFCEENIEKYHTKPILFKTDRWIVTENAWPYDGAKKHWLLIYKFHIEHTKEIDGMGWKDIGEILKRLEKEEDLDYGTFLMRFGDTAKTGATVLHVHLQLIQSDPDSPSYDPKVGIFTRIG
jgi:diadenosine tetraphosphate (Ap4A) HIT family hydrolase